MCGLFAILSRQGRIDPEDLTRGRDALGHRGPDGRGAWLSPDGAAGVAHTRLAVIDLLGGGQPFVSEDQKTVCAINGELYDFERTRDALEARGHRFQSRSDGEIALHLYEDHGPKCLDHLRGEFALIIWDARRRRLFAARDRFGVKPLCFLDTGARVYLASEAKAIFAAGEPAELDPEAFLRALTLQYPPEDRTLFRRIHQLRAGHFLVADAAGLRVERWWDLDFPRSEDRAPVSDDAAAESVLAALDEAVRLRLRADVPVAIQLSGGLDSSLVLGLAARASPQPMACFGVGFPGAGGYDERAIAEDSAARAGARFSAIDAGPLDLIAALSDAVYASEGLAVNGHLMAKHLLHRAVRAAGFKVILTGEGSDEVFLGYPHFVRDLLGDRATEGELADLSAQHQASRGIMLPAGDALPLEALRRRLGFVPTFLAAKATLGHRLRRLLRDDVVRALEARDPFAELLDEIDLGGQLAGRHPVDQSAYLWLKVAFAGYLLRTLGDGTEMWHGVEGRLPYLDHHVFVRARQLPPEQRMRGGIDKHVLRLAAREHVSPAVRARPKHPFLAPPLFQADGALPAAARDVLGSSRFRSGSFFDPAKVQAMIAQLPAQAPAERGPADAALMLVLTTALIAERFLA
ncbi:MAG: asparagine synthase (glutamine-hydrolyzing) [Deltaproteobacteria bacterium]|nr:asparagine synthase (glutamine-hydrolyzing) [Deltaproteobacteria bacterium]